MLNALRLLAVAQTVLVAGCAGYQIGARTLYRPDIRTVAVPIFRSQTLRRNVGEWLTEAVVKEIEQQTPYKVVPASRADTVLSGSIISVTKRTLAENINDEPRSLELGMHVQVRWTDRSGNTLFQHAVPLGLPDLTVSESAAFIPEGGQSLTTAQQENIRRVAKQIVARMEFTPL